MRRVAVFALLLLPSAAPAQTAAVVEATEARLGGLKYVYALEVADGGFRPEPNGKVGLRATSASVRAVKYFGGKVPHPDKHAAFVLACLDPQTGGFADAPGGPPDVTLTAVGVMAAVELNVPREKFARAMEFLKANAKTFEDVRIGAAAVEAWGVKDCPFDLAPWFDIAGGHFAKLGGIPTAKDGGARDTASVVAMYLRLGRPLPQPNAVLQVLRDGQRDDGGWGQAGARASDLEACYRVMRAFHLLKEKPADVAKLRAFVLACRAADGGFGVAPGAKSNVGPTYYAAIILKWLDAMEK